MQNCDGSHHISILSSYFDVACHVSDSCESTGCYLSMWLGSSSRCAHMQRFHLTLLCFAHTLALLNLCIETVLPCTQTGPDCWRTGRCLKGWTDASFKRGGGGVVWRLACARPSCVGMSDGLVRICVCLSLSVFPSLWHCGMLNIVSVVANGIRLHWTQYYTKYPFCVRVHRTPRRHTRRYEWLHSVSEVQKSEKSIQERRAVVCSKNWTCFTISFLYICLLFIICNLNILLKSDKFRHTY